MTYTEKRKADRQAMAEAVITLAEQNNYSGKVSELDRRLVVELTFYNGLQLMMAFDGLRGLDTYVLSWHGVVEGIRLNEAKFGSVNAYHGHKATDFAYGFPGLMDLLGRRIASIKDGSAFFEVL